MTSGLQRGSNIDESVVKFLVIPEEREEQFLKKMKSPMFYERFTKDNWKVIYFRALIEEYSKHKGKTNIEGLIDKKIVKKFVKDEFENQGELFN